MLEKLSRDLEDIMKTQIELLQRRSIMPEMKNVPDWIHS